MRKILPSSCGVGYHLERRLKSDGHTVGGGKQQWTMAKQQSLALTR